MKSPRRVVVVSVPAHVVLEWFRNAIGGWPKYLNVPVVTGLPADAEVLYIRERWDAMCVDFMVSHPSFPEVPEGAPAPPWPGSPGFEWKTVRIARDEADEAGGNGA